MNSSRKSTPTASATPFRWRFLLVGSAVLCGFAAVGITLGLLVRQAGAQVTQSHLAFTLHTADGQRITAREHPRDLLLLYFGFTFCPDACPTTLGLLSRVMQGLGPDAKRVQVAFVSIDPARDTPARLKEYLAAFHPDFISLGGTQEEVDAAARAFEVIYRRTPPLAGPDTYGFDHTDLVYVVDRSGRQIHTLGTHLKDEDAVDRLRRSLIALGAAECCHHAPSSAQARLRAAGVTATPSSAPSPAPSTATASPAAHPVPQPASQENP